MWILFILLKTFTLYEDAPEAGNDALDNSS